MAPDVTAERFAENLRRLREAAGLSQDQLAEAMAAEGFPYHQATVYKVETGGRRVPIEEAVALSKVLGVQLGDLIADAPDALAMRGLRSLITRLVGMGNGLELVAQQYEAARMLLILLVQHGEIDDEGIRITTADLERLTDAEREKLNDLLKLPAWKLAEIVQRPHARGEWLQLARDVKGRS